MSRWIDGMDGSGKREMKRTELGVNGKQGCVRFHIRSSDSLPNTKSSCVSGRQVVDKKVDMSPRTVLNVF